MGEQGPPQKRRCSVRARELAEEEQSRGEKEEAGGGEVEEREEDQEGEGAESEESEDDLEEDDGEAQDSRPVRAGGTLAIGTSAATAVVIWMHGLGDSPRGWADVACRVQRLLGHTRWLLPCAPKNPVTCNGGMVMTSWMDLLAIPISTVTPDNGLDLPESVAIIHKLVDSQLALGVPASRVVLGGFSQGGALSLVAALKYPQRLGGACVLSGWCPPSAGVPALLESSPSRASRFLVCHGDADAVVRPGCGGAVRQALEAAGTPVSFHSYPGLGHGSCEAELKHLEGFLREVLPEQSAGPAAAA